MSPVPLGQNFGTTNSVPPVIPERLIAGASDHRATHEGSEVRTYPEAAPVGSRIPRKFAVPPTSKR